MNKISIKFLKDNKSKRKKEIKQYTKEAVEIYGKALRKLAYT
jgi:hypothetical protein